VGWLEAVHGNVIWVTTNVPHESLLPSLKDPNWNIIGRDFALAGKYGR
jgi:hypothetical protein